MIEIWKPIIGYEGLYEVSNMGRVKSLNHIRRTGNFGKYIQRGKILKQYCKDKNSKYLRVSLSNNGIVSKRKVHRLVAESFLPTINDKKLVNHKDENKQNNCVSNLEWVNYSENLIHAYKNNLRKKSCGVNV